LFVFKTGAASIIIFIYQHFYTVLDAINPRISILIRVWKAMEPKVFIFHMDLERHDALKFAFSALQTIRSSSTDRLNRHK